MSDKALKIATDALAKIAETQSVERTPEGHLFYAAKHRPIALAALAAISKAAGPPAPPPAPAPAKPVAPRPFRIRCPKCNKSQPERRVPQLDPPMAVVVEFACEACKSSDDTDCIYRDAAGQIVKALP